MLQETINDWNESKRLKSDLAYSHANFNFISHSAIELEEATN
jgi:hypothetical protein